MDEQKGNAVSDFWDDISAVNSQAKERLGYPTQKPLSLLERIIATSSNEGDVVLDPFCGGGTTLHAAQRLGRRWIGIDVTYLAIGLAQKRIKEAFPGVEFQIEGTPADASDAQVLFDQDPYQFQWWAVSLIDARPHQGKKRGADTGIDGVQFVYTAKDKTERVLVQVKGGKSVSVRDIRDFVGTLDRTKAPIGVFLTLHPATAPMIKEAVSAGTFKCDFGTFERVQILSIEELFAGKRPHLPPQNAAATLTVTPKEQKQIEQGTLL